MRKLPAALVTLAAAVNLVVLAVPASAAGRRSFHADPKTVRAGQEVKVFGEGCRSHAFVHIYLNGIEIDDDRADRKGRFVDYVEIPGSVDPGQHRLKAGCNGHGLGSVTITVRPSRFKVEPRTVAPGGTITVSGSGCKPGSYVTVKLDHKKIADGHANRKGKFRISVEIPEDTSEGAHRVSARCHGRFVGSQLIEVVEPYPAPLSLLTVDRTAVPAGQAVTLGGSKCPPATRWRRWTARRSACASTGPLGARGSRPPPPSRPRSPRAGTRCGPAASPVRPGPPSCRSWTAGSRAAADRRRQAGPSERSPPGGIVSRR